MSQRAVTALTVIAAVLGLAAAILGLVTRAWGVAALGLAVIAAAVLVRKISDSRFDRRVP